MGIDFCSALNRLTKWQVSDQESEKGKKYQSENTDTLNTDLKPLIQLTQNCIFMIVLFHKS